MNRRCEEERADKAPKPLHRGESAPSERRGAGALHRTRGTSAARPPEIKPEENRLDDRSKRHAKVYEQQRPHVGRNKSNDSTGDNGTKRNGQPRPTTGRAILRCHLSCPWNGRRRAYSFHQHNETALHPQSRTRCRKIGDAAIS